MKLEVVCDYCNKDFSNSDERGGILFNDTHGICENCAKETRARAKQYAEDHLILENNSQTFAEFIATIRSLSIPQRSELRTFERTFAKVFNEK